MPREIKFRAWDKDDQMMMPVYDLVTSDNGTEFDMIDVGGQFGIRCGDCEELSDFVLMQYTGMKDCKGNEIYEGDLVVNIGQVHLADGTFYNEEPEIIRWDDGSAGYRPFCGPYNYTLHKAEVIGNIYETPNLIPTKE